MWDIGQNVCLESGDYSAVFGYRALPADGLHGVDSRSTGVRRVRAHRALPADGLHGVEAALP